MGHLHLASAPVVARHKGRESVRELGGWEININRLSAILMGEKPVHLLIHAIINLLLTLEKHCLNFFSIFNRPVLVS